MRLLNYLLILTTSAMLISPVSFADIAIKHVHAPVVFQVIQDQMNIDNSMIKNVSIITNSNGSYGGLQIELKHSASKELTHMTAARVGKMANLVLNDKIYITAKLSEPFAHKLFINANSISKEDAQAFIDSLK